MKRKNLLKAKMNVGGIPVNFFCRKMKSGYRWYGNDGRGERLVIQESMESLSEAKSALVVTYPPGMYGLEASWVSA